MTMQELSKEQRLRYARNISVDSIGEEGQRKLLASSVFILGCGALGSVVATYLAGAGIGRLTIADYDTIDITNLQRQTHYSEADAGKSKAAVLASHLRDLNSGITVETVETLVTEAKACELFKGHNFIIDASDNPDTKYMIDSVCESLSLPYCIAGVLGFGGQVMTHTEGTARYRDFFPDSAGAGFTPCSIGGVVGPVVGIVGSIQALEAIKYLTGSGRLLTDRLLLIDGAGLHFTEINL